MNKEQIDALKVLVDMTRHNANVVLELAEGQAKVATCSTANLYNFRYWNHKTDIVFIGDEWLKIESFLLSLD